MADADPRKAFNVHDAKTQLSKLLDRAHAGEEIVIAKAGKPYAKLVPFVDVAPRQPRKPGKYKDLLKDVPGDTWCEPTFTDAELDEFERRIDNP